MQWIRISKTSDCGGVAVESGGEDGRNLFRTTGDDSLFVLLIEEFLGYLWGRRYPIAFVHGELALFPNHGFVPCFYHPRVYLSTDVAMSLPARYRVRHLKSDDLPAIAAQKRLPQLNDPTANNRTFFAGSYFRNGFHEDAFRSAHDLAKTILGSDPWEALPE